MVVIPDFNQNGLLPIGIHFTVLAAFVTRFGFNNHRRVLIEGLKLAIRSLKIAGCQVIYIDGSFVTSKIYPTDYDACWALEGVNENIIDPILCDLSPTGRAIIKIKYKGDLFPASFTEGGTGKTFLDFFQIDKSTGEAKGIVAIKI